MIASDVYKDHGLLLFGLEICVKNETKGTILLNPGRYKLPKPVNKNTWYNYYGYVIAADEKIANNVSKSNPGCVSENENLEQEKTNAIQEIARHNQIGNDDDAQS
jgi:hypothetical protein